MTVIAWRDGIMAADTAVWQNNLIAGHHQKIARLPDGRLLGCAGERPLVLACRAWLSGLGEKPAPAQENGFGGLIVGVSGVERVSWRFDIYDAAAVTFGFAVEGAHGDFMLGALHAGASAEEAVRLAIQFGDSAGGDVQVERM